jgi:hypothetical protein
MSYSVWEPISVHELYEYSDPRQLLSAACQQNHISIVQKLFVQLDVSAFDLMGMVINGNRTDMTTWKYIIKFVQKEDATRTFQCFKKTTHTLLSYLCSVLHYEHLDIAKEKITSLLDLGCQWDYEIDQKTPLSYLIEYDDALPLLSWCIHEKGANPHDGHLLVYASNGITKKQHMDRSNVWKAHVLHAQEENADIDRDVLQTYKPFKNKRVFTYLLELDLDVEDCIDSGMTPFIAACSEGTLYKVQQLLEKGVSIYKKTKEGTDAWFWANIHYREVWGDDPSVRFLRDTLRQYEERQSHFWTSLLEVSRGSKESLLQDVPIQELLQVFVRCL